VAWLRRGDEHEFQSFPLQPNRSIDNPRAPSALASSSKALNPDEHGGAANQGNESARLRNRDKAEIRDTFGFERRGDPLGRRRQCPANGHGHENGGSSRDYEGAWVFQRRVEGFNKLPANDLEIKLRFNLLISAVETWAKPHSPLKSLVPS